MKSYACPHCGERTISLWRRLSLGPARPTACSACGNNVGVPWSSLWLIPLALVASRGVQLVAFGFETSLAASLTGAFVGLVLALCLWVWAWLKWVPLVRV